MAGISKWERSKRKAMADEVLCRIARYMRWHNQTYRAPDTAAFMAFKDRTEELGLYVPNGYHTYLFGMCLSDRACQS
jgi:hypothetical protein